MRFFIKPLLSQRASFNQPPVTTLKHFTAASLEKEKEKNVSNPSATSDQINVLWYCGSISPIKYKMRQSAAPQQQNSFYQRELQSWTTERLQQRPGGGRSRTWVTAQRATTVWPSSRCCYNLTGFKHFIKSEALVSLSVCYLQALISVFFRAAELNLVSVVTWLSDGPVAAVLIMLLVLRRPHRLMSEWFRRSKSVAW